MPIQENHSTVKWSTIGTNFKTDLGPPADSFENFRRPDHAMNKQDSENVTDRELFSELFETPINPLLIYMVLPFIDEILPMFHLQINGEAVYKWREVYGRPRTVFDLLQASILPVGYQMKESARERVGNTTAESIRRFWRKMQSTN